MYTITSLLDPKEVIEKFCTIDAAIIAAREMSRTSEGARRLVRDNVRIRVIAYEGRAHWAVSCAPCKGKGRVTGGPMGWMGPTDTACDRCLGLGVVEDLMCQ